MKRFLLLLVACVSFASCSETLDAEEKKDPIEQGGDDNKEYIVSFKVDVRIPELEEEVINDKDDERAILYVEFYNNFFINKKAISQDYLLTFKKDGEIIGEYSGKWGETEIILSNGAYQVTGECPGDFNTASLSFDENVVIDKNTSVLTLTPEFTSWLFAFDRRAFSNAWRCNGETDELTYLNKTDDLFYVFNSTSIPKLPFVLGHSANCNGFHEQIEYPEGNIWHLGLTWQDEDKNYPGKVWYFKNIGNGVNIGWFYLADKDERIVERPLPNS